MNFAIIDDEKAARDELAYLVKLNFDNAKIIEFENGQSLIDYPEKNRLDIAFIDMNLGDFDGLTIGRCLKEVNKEISIIFATAYDDFALESYELGTFDYLTKPLDPRRFSILVKRLKEHIKMTRKLTISENPEVLAVTFNKKTDYVDLDSIVYIESSNRKSYVHTVDNETMQTTEKISDLEEKLKNDNFIRTHKSYIINTDYISKVQYFGNNSYDVIMKYYDDFKIPISRKKIKEFKDKVNIK